MKRMKILLVGTIAGNGGIQSHLKWLAKALSEEGIQVSVFSFNSTSMTEQEVENLQMFWKHKVNLTNFTDNKQANKNSVISNWQKLTEVAQNIKSINPDIYLVVGTSWTAVVAPILAKIPAKLIFHEVMSGMIERWQNPTWFVRWFFHEVVAQAPPVAENFQTITGWKRKIPSIPAFPEPLEITGSLPKVSVKKVKLGQTKAAFFSRLVAHKGALWLVQQWDSLKDVLAELHLYGTGPEEKLIQDYIVSQGIEDRVKCFGRYPEGQDYVNLLSSYDLTLLPTVGAEGSPLVLLESMACSIPFVTYGVGGVPAYGVNNPNVIVVPPEPWLTNQAQYYSLPKISTPVKLSIKEWKKVYNSYGQPLPQAKSFINGVRSMTERLARKDINQAELQNFYLKNYSYEVLKKRWLFYLHNLWLPAQTPTKCRG